MDGCGVPGGLRSASLHSGPSHSLRLRAPPSYGAEGGYGFRGQFAAAVAQGGYLLVTELAEGGIAGAAE